MRALRLTGWLTLLSLVMAATTVQAAAPPVVSHTYLVNYALSGHYHSSTQYSTGGQYCAGSGYTEDADFNITVAKSIRVKLDGEALASGQVLLPPDVGTWEMKGKVFPSNDCSQSAMAESCSGDLGFQNNQRKDTLYAKGAGTKVAFEFQLSTGPEELMKPNDCDANNSDLAPPPSPGLFLALAPYEAVSFSVGIESLARGKKFSGTAKPVKVTSSYSVATCNHNPPCAGALTKFVSQVTVTQTN